MNDLGKAAAMFVSEQLNVPVEDILGDRQLKDIARARHCVALCLRKCEFTLKEIGKAIGRDHTTIRNSLAIGDPELNDIAERFADKSKASLVETFKVVKVELTRKQLEEYVWEKASGMTGNYDPQKSSWLAVTVETRRGKYLCRFESVFGPRGHEWRKSDLEVVL